MNPNPLDSAVDQQLLVRRADADDAAFVFSYWLRDYYEHSAFAKGIDKTLFMHLHHLLLERIIARSVIHIVCDVEDPSVCYGFICAEGPVLHYIFVKRRFRRLGLARRLLREAGLEAGPQAFTHLTDTFVGLRKRWPAAQYNPYAI